MNLYAGDIEALELSCVYQPIIHTQSLTCYGYEALARFKDSQQRLVPPNIVFDHFHKDSLLLGQLEYQAKCLQLEHAPNDAILFLNVDPHILVDFNGEQFLSIFANHNKLVIEVIENSCINDANLANELVSKLTSLGVEVALDDIGAAHSMLSLMLLSKVNILKFDRSWFSLLDDKNYGLLLNSLIQYAKASGKLCVLEGVETEADLQLAQNLNIDLVQGFLFRDQFIQAGHWQPVAIQTIASSQSQLALPA